MQCNGIFYKLHCNTLSLVRTRVAICVDKGFAWGRWRALANLTRGRGFWLGQCNDDTSDCYIKADLSFGTPMPHCQDMLSFKDGKKKAIEYSIFCIWPQIRGGQCRTTLGLRYGLFKMVFKCGKATWYKGVGITIEHCQRNPRWNPK